MELKSKTGRIRAITSIIILAAIILTITNAVITNAKNAKETIMDNDILRLHIIANSDSDFDQEVKLKVRDAVLDYERRYSDAEAVESAREAEKLLLDDGSSLLQTVRQVLSENDAGYDAQLVIGDFEFPDCTYDDELYPAGVYRAVRILLGNAEGKNWWCVLFPQLCIGTAADSVELEAIDGLARQPEYRLSFALVEWLERLLAAAKQQ